MRDVCEGVKNDANLNRKKETRGLLIFRGVLSDLASGFDVSSVIECAKILNVNEAAGTTDSMYEFSSEE